MRFLTQEVSSETYLNIMAQYYPYYKAFDILQISRPVNKEEFYEAINLAHQQGLYRLDSSQSLLPLKFILR